MGLSIQTNYASLTAQNNLSKTQGMQATTFQRLSSGYRINGAADDAAGLGISMGMDSRVRSYAVAQRNANDAISMAQTADGAAGQISDMLGRMRELAVQASSGDLQAADHTNLDTEFQAITSEIDRVATVSQFNGVNLLSGAAAAVKFQVGIGTSSSDQVSVTFGAADTAGLAVGGNDLTTVANAQTSITKIDAAIQSLAGVREGFGSAINRFTESVNNIQSMSTNTTSALGRIRDVDVAEESAKMARQSVLSQAGAAVLAQANQSPQLALSLLR